MKADDRSRLNKPGHDGHHVLGNIDAPVERGNRQSHIEAIQILKSDIDLIYETAVSGDTIYHPFAQAKRPAVPREIPKALTSSQSRAFVDPKKEIRDLVSHLSDNDLDVVYSGYECCVHVGLVDRAHEIGKFVASRFAVRFQAQDRISELVADLMGQPVTGCFPERCLGFRERKLDISPGFSAVTNGTTTVA